MIRTIYFDFGNVVAFFDHNRALREFARFTHLDPVELGIVLYGSPIEDAYERGKLTTAEFVREAILDGRLSCSPEEFLAFYTNIFSANPEVCGLIPKLKPRYRLVLASNTNEAHFARFTRDYSDVLEQFGHLAASHHAGSRKPEAEFFAHVKQFANAEAHECVFVDDLPVNVEAASQAGFHGIVYTPNVGFIEQLRQAGVALA